MKTLAVDEGVIPANSHQLLGVSFQVSEKLDESELSSAHLGVEKACYAFEPEHALEHRECGGWAGTVQRNIKGRWWGDDKK